MSKNLSRDVQILVKESRFLIGYLGISSVEQAVAIIGNYFPENRVQPKTKYMLMELFGGH